MVCIEVTLGYASINVIIIVWLYLKTKIHSVYEKDTLWGHVYLIFKFILEVKLTWLVFTTDLTDVSASLSKNLSSSESQSEKISCQSTSAVGCRTFTRLHLPLSCWEVWKPRRSQQWKMNRSSHRLFCFPSSSRGRPVHISRHSLWQQMVCCFLPIALRIRPSHGAVYRNSAPSYRLSASCWRAPPTQTSSPSWLQFWIHLGRDHVSGQAFTAWQICIGVNVCAIVGENSCWVCDMRLFLLWQISRCPFSRCDRRGGCWARGSCTECWYRSWVRCCWAGCQSSTKSTSMTKRNRDKNALKGVPQRVGPMRTSIFQHDCTSSEV